MSSHATQKGFSFFTLLLWLIIGGFGALLLLKIGPMYMNNMTIQAVLDGLKERNLTDTPSHSQIRSQISKQLGLNGMESIPGSNVGEGEEKIQIVSEGAFIKVLVNYEVREHIVANLDVVAKFTNSTELPIR